MTTWQLANDTFFVAIKASVHRPHFNLLVLLFVNVFSWILFIIRWTMQTTIMFLYIKYGCSWLSVCIIYLKDWFVCEVGRHPNMWSYDIITGNDVLLHRPSKYQMFSNICSSVSMWSTPFSTIFQLYHYRGGLCYWWSTRGDSQEMWRYQRNKQ